MQHVKADKKIGLDLQEEVIRAARELSDGKINFEVGSFGNLTEIPVDYLITLNFMHGRIESEWVETYHVAAVRNDVQHFVVDTVPDKIFGPFLSGRYVEIWEKQ